MRKPSFQMGKFQGPLVRKRGCSKILGRALQFNEGNNAKTDNTMQFCVIDQQDVCNVGARDLRVPKLFMERPYTLTYRNQASKLEWRNLIFRETTCLQLYLILKMGVNVFMKQHIVTCNNLHNITFVVLSVTDTEPIKPHRFCGPFVPVLFSLCCVI